MKQSFFILVLAVVCVHSASAACFGSDDIRFLDGLRQRRLFGLAETYCRRRLGSEELSGADRVQLTAELIRLSAEHAVNSPPDERDGHWQQAHRVAADFRAAHAGHPRLVLVLVQDTLAYIAQGELARREAEIAPSPESSLLAARQTIRQAVALCEELDKQLPQEVQLAHRKPSRIGALSAAQLSSLHQNVRYQLARAYRNRALCYAPQSPDRTAALTEALDLLRRPMLELSADSPLIRRIQIDQVVCHRLLQAWQQAAELLTALEQQELPPAETLQVRAERARLQLARAEPQRALQTIGKGRELNGHASPELDFAHLETYVSLWQVTSDKGQAVDAQRWQRRSIAAVEFIEQTHGAYWARRAELLLIGSGRHRGSGSIEILVRTASDLFLKGRLDEALLTYEKASVVAAEAGRSDEAFELSFKAGLIDQQRKRNREASLRFQELAQANKAHPRSGKTHLRAIFNAAEAVKAGTAVLPRYVDMLERHLRDWPRDPTANPAAILLGEQRETEQEWGLAIAAYREVSPDSPQFATAVDAAGRCWSKWLARRQASSQAVEELATQAVDYCGGVVRNAKQEWNAARRSAAVTGARLRLVYLPERAAEATASLESALNGSPDATDEWKSTARSLLIAALATLPGRTHEAGRMLRELPSPTPRDLLSIIDGLTSALAAVSVSQGQQIAEFQLLVINRLGDQINRLDDRTGLRLAVARATALKVARRDEDAIDAYAKLAEQHVNDRTIQRAYAESLLQAEGKEYLVQARDRWRIIARRARRRSELWFEAKYSVALVLFKLGDKQGAAKLILYLEATEDLAASGWHDRFAELKRRCQG